MTSCLSLSSYSFCEKITFKKYRRCIKRDCIKRHQVVSAAKKDGFGLLVFVLSDLHTDYPENMAWVRNLSTKRHDKDVLLVTGDVAETYDNFVLTMSLLKERFEHVFFVPGNHDLWCRWETEDVYFLFAIAYAILQYGSTISSPPTFIRCPPPPSATHRRRLSPRRLPHPVDVDHQIFQVFSSRRHHLSSRHHYVRVSLQLSGSGTRTFGFQLLATHLLLRQRSLRLGFCFASVSSPVLYLPVGLYSSPTPFFFRRQSQPPSPAVTASIVGSHSFHRRALTEQFRQVPGLFLLQRFSSCGVLESSLLSSRNRRAKLLHPLQTRFLRHLSLLILRRFVPIFIMGLPVDVKEREMQNLLRWLPGFEDSHLSYKGEKPKGFALFSNAEFAVAAKDALQKMVFDSKLKSLLHIEMARKNLVVKRGIISNSDAPVPPVHPLPNPASLASPSIHVPFKSGSCDEKSAVDGVHDGIRESITKECNVDKYGCYTLFVENLPENIHWKRLVSFFCSHGQVIDAFIPNKRNAKGVRFGFIRFASIEEARRETSKMNGSYIDGSKIGVSFAKFKPRQSYWRKSSTGVLHKSGMEDDSRKKHYKVEGVIDEEKLQVLNYCLVGWCKNFIKISHLTRQMHAKGLTGFSLMRAAGNAVLMIFEDSASLRSVKNDKSETLAEWFSIIEAWSESLVLECRRVWLVCEGVPFHTWNWDTFKNIADSWGQLLAIDESCQSPSSFDRAKIQVLAKAGARIDATLELKVGDNSFKIMVHEIEPSFKPNSWAPEEDESN
ncbi:White-brown complex protein 11 [Hibiscus syriacus]|uniref:White-brown complex protein 11 n=1 Tax=Hibiscus syriacus TaxID=106335 RepID=A0A6A3B679_HIBSY|nr:White-brown complex protein 11 [Hibiscus syriacus]